MERMTAKTQSASTSSASHAVEDESWRLLAGGLLVQGDTLLEIGPKLLKLVSSSSSSLGKTAMQVFVSGPPGFKEQDRQRDLLPFPLCDLPEEGTQHCQRPSVPRPAAK